MVHCQTKCNLSAPTSGPTSDSARSCATLPGGLAGKVQRSGEVLRIVSVRKLSLMGSCLVTLLVAGLIASCAPNPTAQLISPFMVAASEEGITLVVRIVPKLSELTEEEVFAGVPEDVVTAIQTGDSVNGMEISELQGCAGCHSLQEDEVLSGPSWYDIANTAVGRVEGESPALYLYRSITQPNAFVVRRFDANVMPEDFNEKLSTAEIGDLMAFLLEQNEE